MLEIYCLTTFLDDRDRFFEGETRFVDDEARGYKFIGNKWACLSKDRPAASVATTDADPVTLNIDNVKHTAGDNHG